MINSKSITAINKGGFSKYFIKPLYDSYCFSNIPKTIKNVLTGTDENGLPKDVFGDLPQKYDKVILFFIDAFGWRFFEKYKDHFPFLKRIVKEGVVSKLTCQFPSTTAAHTTCLYSGKPVCESGIFEWFYYEPEIDNIIAPLLFSYAGTKELDSLVKAGVDPKQIYPSGTFYKELKQYAVRSYCFESNEYADCVYQKAMSSGSEIIPYRTLTEALTNLINLAIREKNKSYYVFYFDKIDTICHRYGPDSKQLESEINSFLTVLENIFYQNSKGKLKDTLFIMTADHGQTAINPQTTFYLNLKMPEIKKYMKTNKKGEYFVPAGSCRDMFLYIKDEYLMEAKNLLQKNLKGIAKIYKTSDLIKEGFFGSTKPSTVFLKRVGNLVILPYKGNSVWWYEKDKFEIKYFGHHGGLTRDEMEIPLLLYSFK